MVSGLVGFLLAVLHVLPPCRLDLEAEEDGDA